MSIDTVSPLNIYWSSNDHLLDLFQTLLYMKAEHDKITVSILREYPFDPYIILDDIPRSKL